MTKFTFADRYAEAGLSPTSQIILSRQEPVNKIVSTIEGKQVLDLVVFYYGSSDVDLSWLRDEFVKEDASFSLVNNERETRVLAALILGQLIENEHALAILAVSVGNFRGFIKPSQSRWLIQDAEDAIGQLSVEERELESISTKVSPSVTNKLGEELTALTQNDWATLIALLGKIRLEAQTSAKTTASQITAALKAFERRSELMREESQMLWWLIGGYSRTFERSFTSFGIPQAAIVGAVDLGALTTKSVYGPIAMPAMLDRVIASAKRSKGQQTCELATAIDGFDVEDLKCLQVPTTLPARLTPVALAIDLARNLGIGKWHSQFHDKAGLEPSIKLDPISLAEQLYRECLLGQLY
jgi:hypothetical protein